MRRTAHIVFLFFALLLTVESVSQKKPIINVSSNRDSILLGEQFEFSIELAVPLNLKLSAFPAIPDTGQHLEVISRGVIDSTISADFRKFRQTIVMTGFDSGRWKLPQVTYQQGKDLIQSRLLQIDVVPVSLKGKDYNDIHEIVEVEKPPFQWWKVLLISVLGILAVFSYMYLKKKRARPITSFQEKSNMGSFEIAVSQMKRLKEDQLIQKGEVKKFYIGLYDILRVYIAVKYTDDMVMKLITDLDKENASSGIQGLRVCEAVKFAKYSSSPSEADSTWRTFYKVLELLNDKKSRK